MPSGLTGRGAPVSSPTPSQAVIARIAIALAKATATAPTSQHQFDALVSFHYNTGAIAKTTLTWLHVAGYRAGAAQPFALWVHAGGVVMRGLVRRIEAEAALYRTQ